MRKRPNPTVALAERAAATSEKMADLAEKTLPKVSSLPRRIAMQKRAAANKLRREH